MWDQESISHEERELVRSLIWLDNVCRDCEGRMEEMESPCDEVCLRCYQEYLG